MGFQLVAFEIHLSFKNNKFFVQTFLIQAQKVVFLEMLLKSIIVDIILLLAVARLSITDMASLMLVSTMGVELVVSIEALTAKFTLGMSLETALVDSTGVIVAEFLVFPKLRYGEQFIFVSERFFVACTEIAVQEYQHLDTSTQNRGGLTT